MLSVVIVTFNCRDLAMACLRTLEAERPDVRLEAILVDNASSDGTLAAIRRGFPWVTPVDARGNVGFASEQHRAVSDAGQVCPAPQPRHAGVARSVGLLSARPRGAAGGGMLGCQLVQPGGRLDHACKRGFPTPLASLWYLIGLTRLRPRSRRFAHYTAGHVAPDETSVVDAINGAFMLVRREALEDVGALDERFWMYGEDLDWCLRFWKAG